MTSLDELTDYAPHSSAWRSAEPEPLICDHGRPEGSVLCPDCEDLFGLILADIPALLVDLELALTKQVSFLAQGSFVEADPDEAPLTFSLGASKALDELRRCLGLDPVTAVRQLLGDWRATLRRPDLERLVLRITTAVADAHHVIDRPPTLSYYGLCPNCGKGIKAERIVVGDGRMVECPCGYRAPLARHQAAQLDLGEDKQLTLTELLRVLNDGGEPCQRHDIENLIYRNGLPREREPRPYWAGGRLHKNFVYTYRLGTVRTMLLARRIRRTG